MQLHGSEISLKDSVYDIVLGYGRVSRVGSSTVTVEYASGMQFAYSEKGERTDSGRATLYFHDPFVVIPPKSLQKWTAQKAALVSVLTLIESK
jgi:hypothetical protein